MKTIVLRFRDLNIPDGETIRRHRAKIEAHGCVWWGWIMRQTETFPENLLAQLAQELEGTNGRTVYLFHSGECRLYPAALGDVAAYPGGARIQTPEVQKTPTYMAEAELPAWLKLTVIGEPLSVGFTVAIEQFPTLTAPPEVDQKLAGRKITDASDLRLSTATLWSAIVEAK